MYFLEKDLPTYYCKKLVHLRHYIQIKKNFQLIALWSGWIPQAQPYARKGLSAIAPAVDKFIWIKEFHHIYNFPVEIGCQVIMAYNRLRRL